MNLDGRWPMAHAAAVPLGSRPAPTASDLFWTGAPGVRVPRPAHPARTLRARLVVVLLAVVSMAAVAMARAPGAYAADPLAPPVAAIAITGSVHFAGEAVAFTDASTGEVIHRRWTFGDDESDANVSHREQPSHTYANAGSYTVTLTVSSDRGTSVATVRIAILGPWTGQVQLYTLGVYSKQATMRLCVAASTQIIRNIVYDEQDHSKRMQSAYNAYGRAHNAYKTPPAAGVDPAGWQAMLRRYVDPGYRIFASYSYVNTLKQAARAIRLTDRPAGVFVSHGMHVWVISGFTATADPAVTNTFTVTSVSVIGPLFGVRPSINGYDPRPDIHMSVSRFSHYLLPFRDPYEPKGWRNRYVVVIP